MTTETIEKTWTPTLEVPFEEVFMSRRWLEGKPKPRYGVTRDGDYYVVLKKEEGGEWEPTTHLPPVMVNRVQDLFPVLSRYKEDCI